MQIKQFIRNIAAGTAAFAILLFATLPAGAQVAVTVNGDEVNFSPEPIIQAGRVFVPLRGVFERLGASVVYSNGTINATGDGRTISLQIGSSQATIDGQPQTLDVAPFIVGASTFVPLRFVSEALGASVNWDNTDRVVSIATAGGAAPSYSSPVNDYYTSEAPPPLPEYDQPPVPAPNYIWQPGYWAWGAYGYYWVPGTWVEAPQPGYLWTPGYWGSNNGGYAWNQGYWALAIGFYGGVNYGGGYFGNGYDGGRWSDGQFRYNTYVTHVDTTVINNVYVDRNVYVNSSPSRISYNGGEHGLQVRPTTEQLGIAAAPHLGMTPLQRQHLEAAAQDRRLLATVNHDRPPVLAVAKPLSADNRPDGFEPVKPEDRLPASVHPPVAPAYHAPVEHPVPVYHAPAVQPAYRAPVVQPAYHAPVVHPVPVYHAPVQPVPAYHAPGAPDYRAPQVHANPGLVPAHSGPPHPGSPKKPAVHAPPHGPDHDPNAK